MRFRKTVLVVTLAALGTLASGTAEARGGRHWGFGWGLGLGLAVTAPWVFARPYYYPPSYYYPPAYYPSYSYAPAYGYSQPAYSAPAYAQPSAPSSQDYSFSYYYCAGANGYYPYVRQCPGGWQAIPSRPPGT